MTNFKIAQQSTRTIRRVEPSARRTQFEWGSVLLRKSGAPPTPDTKEVIIRPISNRDNEFQRAFFHSLSEVSRFYRFMTPLVDVPPCVMRQLSLIDDRSHVALLAEKTEGTRKIMVGEVRYFVDEEDSATGQLGIAVHDDWQGLGIGINLLDRLEHCAAILGIRRIVADTLVENVKMLRLAAHAGYKVTMNCVDPRLKRLEKILIAA
jgi:acetyltransferase